MRSRTLGYEGLRWECYFYWQGWDNINLGLHLNWRIPNVEIHLPFGFIRAGMASHYDYVDGNRLLHRVALNQYNYQDCEAKLKAAGLWKEAENA